MLYINKAGKSSFRIGNVSPCPVDVNHEIGSRGQMTRVLSGGPPLDLIFSNHNNPPRDDSDCLKKLEIIVVK